MLAQKLILSYASRIFVQIIQIIASIIVARVAGPTVLGTVAFGYAYVSLFSFVADLGIGSAHIKLVSEGKDIEKCQKTFAVLKLLVILFYTFVVLCVFLFQKFIANYNFESTEHIYVIFISLSVVILQQLILIPNTTFMARTEQAKQDVPQFIQTLLYQILRIVIALLGFGAVLLAFGQLISIIVIIPVVIFLSKDFKYGSFDKALAKDYIKIAFPLILIGATATLTSYIDVNILQFFTSSEEVGYYTAGYRVGGFILTIANSVGLLFFPLFSQAFAKGDYGYIRDKILQFERFSFIFIMPVVIIVSVYSELIVKILLGSQYFSSIEVMKIISISMFIMVFSMPYGNVLTGIGKFNLTAKITLFAFIFFIVVLIIFVNPYILNLGATGAAISVLFSKLLLGSLLIFYAKRNFHYLIIKNGLKLFLFGLIVFFFYEFIYDYLNTVLIKVLFIPLFFSFIYVILFALKLLKKEDWNNLKTLIDLKSLGKYIKGEFTKK